MSNKYLPVIETGAILIDYWDRYIFLGVRSKKGYHHKVINTKGAISWKAFDQIQKYAYSNGCKFIA